MLLSSGSKILTGTGRMQFACSVQFIFSQVTLTMLRNSCCCACAPGPGPDPDEKNTFLIYKLVGIEGFLQRSADFNLYLMKRKRSLTTIKVLFFVCLSSPVFLLIFKVKSQKSKVQLNSFKLEIKVVLFLISRYNQLQHPSSIYPSTNHQSIYPPTACMYSPINYTPTFSLSVVLFVSIFCLFFCMFKHGF